MFSPWVRSRRQSGSAEKLNPARRRRILRAATEALEERRLLSASTLDITSGALTYSAAGAAASSLTVSIDPSNTANVIFTDSDQNIGLTSNAVNAGWTVVNSSEVTGPLSSFSSEAISGTTTLGQSLTLDYSSGDPLPASGLNYNPTAASGNAANVLTLQSGLGGTTFTSETYARSGAGPGAGTITYSDSAHSNVPVAFTNLTPINDVVPSPTFTFTAPAGATTVNVNTGPIIGGAQTDQINDGGTGDFELVNFANTTAATVNVPASGATTTLNIPSVATGLTSLNVTSGAGGESVNVQAIPAGINVNVDTGSVAGSKVNIGLGDSLGAIDSPVFVKSTGGTNTLNINDSSESSAQTYTIAGSRVTATSFPSFIDFSGGGITTLGLTSAGLGDTFDFTGPVQSSITTYNFSADGGAGPNTLAVTSNVSALSDATAGVLGFGAGNPTLNYVNFQTINVTKPATAPAGAPVTINATQGQALNNVLVATFTQGDLGNAPADFTATINWGDATTSPGTIQASGSNSFNILGSHTYSTGGTFTVTVALTDLGSTGSAVVSGVTINVTSTGPVASTPNPIASTAVVGAAPLTGSAGNVITGVEGNSTGTALLGTFVDGDPAATAASYTSGGGSVVVNWGDGSAPQTLAASNLTAIGTASSVTWTINAAHTYTEEGTYAYKITVTASDGAATIVSGSAVIADAALVAGAATFLTPSTGVAIPRSTVVATFDDANTFATTSDFTGVVDWGDGSPQSTGTLVATATPGVFDVEEATPSPTRALTRPS